MAMIEVQSSNNKRMAKNALMLLFRMTLTMGVSLYTSRVVLQVLGVEDYGIYHVVAGFVTIIGFLYGAMSSATQRFLSFELGKQGTKDLRGIFSMSLNIHFLIALIVLLLGETVGLWFLKNYMTIPIDRLDTAKWVFHLSLMSFMITIISVPYNALIIAHEKMEIFAWISIVDVILKLMIVFMLSWFGLDKLFLYAILILVAAIIVFIIYKSYCNFNFSESKFRFYWDKSLFNTLISYTGWNMWGTLSMTMSSQGINILLNMFFGPSINAARAIAMQVAGALNHFGWSLQVAINPQITKSYAMSDLEYMHKLVCYGAKYNFFILLILAMPVFINTDAVLNVWLVSVPAYASIFVQLALINIIIDSMSATLITSAQATGNIKKFEIIVSGILLLNLPLSYLIIDAGVQPSTALYVGIGISIIAFIARLVILEKLTSLPVVKFLYEVVGRAIFILVSTGVLSYILINNLLEERSFWIESILITFCVLISILFFGFGSIERNYILKALKNRKIKV